MPSRRIAPLFAVVLSWSAAVQAESIDELNRRASLHFSRGEYAEAQAVLERMLRIAPSPKIHFNLGSVHLRLKNDEKVIEHFRAYLAGFPSAPNRNQVEGEMAAAEDRIAARGSPANIESTPNGASVFLGGSSQPLGTTPFRTTLPIGQHSLRFVLKGHSPREVEVVVEKRRPTAVSVALAPPISSLVPTQSALLEIEATVKEAAIFIDGESRRLGINSVSPGTHDVRVTHKGYLAWQERVLAKAGETHRVFAKMTPLPPPPRWRPRVLKFVASGLTVAFGVTAILTYSRANALDKDRVDTAAPGSTRDNELLNEIDTYRKLSLVAQITAGTLAAGSIGLWIVDWLNGRKRGPSDRASPVRLNWQFSQRLAFVGVERLF